MNKRMQVQDKKSPQDSNRGAVVAFGTMAAITGAIAAMCSIAGGAGIGLWAAGGPSAAWAGGLAMGSVGALWLAGATIGAYKAVRAGDGRRAAGIAAAFALAASFTGSGISGFSVGMAEQRRQQASDATIAIPIDPSLKKAFDAGIDPDRKAMILNGLRETVTRRLQKENDDSYEICRNNRESFKGKGIDCADFRPSAP